MRHFAALYALVFLANVAIAQQNVAKDSTAVAENTAVADTLPYIKFPELPAFNILLLDSVTVFNTYNIPKGKPIALLFFDPECHHCKATVRRILKGIDSVSNIQFYLFSSRPDMGLLRKFNKDFHLDDYRNIKVVGRDYEFFFYSFYKTKFVPDLALYDKKKQFVKLFDAGVSVDELFQRTH
jgi:thiol-disulfide isomerase/thioredoxin